VGRQAPSRADSKAERLNSVGEGTLQEPSDGGVLSFVGWAERLGCLEDLVELSFCWIGGAIHYFGTNRVGKLNEKGGRRFKDFRLIFRRPIVSSRLRQLAAPRDGSLAAASAR